MSHETMYNAIYVYPRGELKRELIACLRHHNQVRKPRSRGTDRRDQIQDMQSIHIRPPEVEDRLIPGHWEGDLIKGAGNRSSVGTLVERTTGFVVLGQDGQCGHQDRRRRLRGGAQSRAGIDAQDDDVRSGQRDARPQDPDRTHRRHKSISPTRTARGSADQTRTPMACCASICRRDRTCRFTPKTNSMPLP